MKSVVVVREEQEVVHSSLDDVNVCSQCHKCRPQKLRIMTSQFVSDTEKWSSCQCEGVQCVCVCVCVCVQG